MNKEDILFKPLIFRPFFAVWTIGWGLIGLLGLFLFCMGWVVIVAMLWGNKPFSVNSMFLPLYGMVFYFPASWAITRYLHYRVITKEAAVEIEHDLFFRKKVWERFPFSACKGFYAYVYTAGGMESDTPDRIHVVHLVDGNEKPVNILKTPSFREQQNLIKVLEQEVRLPEYELNVRPEMEQPTVEGMLGKLWERLKP